MIDTEIKGSPASVESAADWLRTTLKPGVESGADALVGARRGARDWGGDAGPAFSEQVGSGAETTDGLAGDVGAAAGLFDAYAAGLRRAQNRMRTIRETASGAGLRVSGFVIEDPGSGPPNPGEPPVDATPVAVDAYNADVRAWNRHQELVTAYNTASTDAQEVFADYDEAATTAEDTYEGLNVYQQTLVASDIVGTTVVAALAAKHHSILTDTAARYADEVEVWRDRIRNGHYDNPSGKDAFDRDFRAQQDAMDRASRAGRNADDFDVKGKPGAAGKAFGVAGVGLGIYFDMQSGESATQAVASNAGGAAIGALAAVGTSAAVGAAVGSAVPVVGTAVGAVVGAGVGLFASGAIDSLFENGPDVEAAWDSGVEAVTDTVGAIGDAGGAVVDTVGGWFD